MFLENIYPHKRNTNVTVAGAIYRIGPGGFICSGEEGREPLDVPEEAAGKLLQGKAWRKLSWDPADPKNVSRFMTKLWDVKTPKGAIGRPPRNMSMVDKTSRPKPIARTDLPPQAIGGAVDRSGNLTGMEQAQPSDRHLEKSLETAQQKESKDVAQQQKLASKDEKAGEFAPQAQLQGDAAVGDGRPADLKPQWLVPNEGGEWPDPVPEMPREYLAQMAEVYEVKFKKNIGTAKLVKRIHDAMYVEE